MKQWKIEEKRTKYWGNWKYEWSKRNDKENIETQRKFRIWKRENDTLANGLKDQIEMWINNWKKKKGHL